MNPLTNQSRGETVGHNKKTSDDNIQGMSDSKPQKCQSIKDWNLHSSIWDSFL